MIRFFSSQAKGIVNTELAKLRKKTGFTLLNCRKALQMCDNDVDRAEEWLKAEAKRLGWEKAMKLQSRVASEGLIGVATEKNKVAMVEVNCETDFVARNEKFVSLTQLVADVCLKSPSIQSGINTKKVLSSEEIGKLKIQNEETLNDYVVQRIGEFGENIILKRAMCYETTPNIYLDAYVHPPLPKSGNNTLTGKYGVFVTYEKTEGNVAENESEDVIVNLCKHIIGMSPQRIGTAEDEPSENPDDEVTLFHQYYMLDNDVTIGEWLESKGVKVTEFHRWQCGEDEVTSKEKVENELEDDKDKIRNV